jgi:hypothetical protein
VVHILEHPGGQVVAGSNPVSPTEVGFDVQ